MLILSMAGNREIVSLTEMQWRDVNESYYGRHKHNTRPTIRIFLDVRNKKSCVRTEVDLQETCL